jgi:acetyl-CoA carboxylase biotin carboxyl carrier protein
VDLSDLKDILRTLEEQDITEFELEQDGVKLRVCRASRHGGPAGPLAIALESLRPTAVGPSTDPPPAGAAGTLSAPASAAASDGGTGGDRHAEVKSPIVGTFYRAPDPNSPPFVSVGDRVRVGQVLCIIEAMKLMNEIEADVAGEVVEIHPENGQPVQYGDALFTIRPS